MASGHAGQDVITPLSARHVRAATDVLLRAFADDPILTFYLTERRRRRFAYRAFFGDAIHAHRRFGHAYAALRDQRVVGAAVWRPPEAGPPTLWERLHTWGAMQTVRTLFPRTAAAMFQGFAATQALHPHAPHWYLFFVGVDPTLQSKGVGARLLAPVLESADRTGTLCYLETPFPRTHVFYRRLGFEIASESHPFVGAPRLWTMIRQPRAIA